jgi:hypothetical protein
MLYGEAVSGIVDDVTIGAAAAEAAQTKTEKKKKIMKEKVSLKMNQTLIDDMNQ